MILIFGSTHDDVSYFEDQLKNKATEKIFGKYDLLTGTMFNQNVGIIYGGFTNYISVAIVSRIIAKNYVVLVINVGKGSAYGDGLKNGDAVISRQVYLGEVNQTGIQDAILGQIPRCPQSFVVDPYILETLNNSLNKVVRKNNTKIGTYVSVEKVLHSPKDLEGITSSSGVIFGHKEDVIVDSVTGGIALACYLNDTPFISIEIVEKHIGEESTVNSLINVINRYSEIGKAVTSFIGEITSNSVIGGK